MTPGGPPVDLEGFRASMREAGIEEIVEPTLAVFVEDAASHFAELNAAVTAGDVDGVRARAHTLKSSAGSIRAQELASLFQELEHVATRGDLDGAARVFENVKPAFRAVMTYLEGAATGE